jgi:F-type H+-transporting ATPase subunit b
MNRRKNLKGIGLLLLALLLVFSAVGVLAQEPTTVPAGEGETATEAEGGAEAAAEGEGEAAAEGEAEAAPATSPLTPLGINQGFLFAQIVNFLAIFGLLAFGLWGPLTRTLDERAAKIAKGLEDAAAAANARLNAENEAQKILQQARAEVQKNVEEGRLRGEEVAKQVEADARKEAEKIVADARASAQQLRDSELAGLRGQVAAIAIAAAQRLIGESLDEKRQRALVDDFFSKVPDGAKMSGQVEVVSAMPLTDSEQSKVKKQIGASDVTFTVDPSILGGLIIRSADRVVDGSVRSSLNELAGRLN